MQGTRQLRDGGVKAEFLGNKQTNEYVDRFFAMNFTIGISHEQFQG